MITKKQRLHPTGKRYAQRVNNAGDAPGVHAKNFKMKVCCFNQLKQGKLVVLRKEITAEWRDGHRLIAAGLVRCESITRDTMYLKPNQAITKDYTMKLARCLKGNTFN